MTGYENFLFFSPLSVRFYLFFFSSIRKREHMTMNKEKLKFLLVSYFIRIFILLLPPFFFVMDILDFLSLLKIANFKSFQFQWMNFKRLLSRIILNPDVVLCSRMKKSSLDRSLHYFVYLYERGK